MSVLKMCPRVCAQHSDGAMLAKRQTLTSSRALKAAGVRAPGGGTPLKGPTGSEPERAASLDCCPR